MLLEILKRTPVWVFVLFAVLVFFGVMQSRTRQIGIGRVTILPVVLIGLSLSGLWSTFSGSGNAWFAIAAWLAAVAAAVLVNKYAKWPRNVLYTVSTGRFLVEGSWLPLAVMMTIFFTRYAVTVTLAINPGLAASPWLAAGVSAAYGLMSGAFLARALRILSARAAAPRS
ncbi:MAG: DUF6622 family protein [Betaproteobacteria bacterium]